MHALRFDGKEVWREVEDRHAVSLDGNRRRRHLRQSERPIGPFFDFAGFGFFACFAFAGAAGVRTTG